MIESIILQYALLTKRVFEILAPSPAISKLVVPKSVFLTNSTNSMKFNPNCEKHSDDVCLKLPNPRTS